MIARIGLIILVIVLIYVAIIIIVRALPGFFSKETKRVMRDFGKNSYVPLYGGRGMWGFFAALFFGPALVPAVAESEQRKILKKALEAFKRRVNSLPSYNLKQLPAVDAKFSEMADGWERQVDEREFEFLPMRHQIERAARNAHEIGRLYPVADELLDECYALLPVAGQHAKSDADLNELANKEQELDSYKAMQFDSSDLIAWQQLIAHLRLIKKTLADCISGASQTATAAPPSEQDYYSVLGVDSGATRDEIKKAYHALAHKYHQDKKAEELKKITDPDIRKAVSDEFDNKLKEINEAYEILSDTNNRAKYDNSRK